MMHELAFEQWLGELWQLPKIKTVLDLQPAGIKTKPQLHHF